MFYTKEMKGLVNTSFCNVFSLSPQVKDCLIIQIGVRFLPGVFNQYLLKLSKVLVEREAEKNLVIFHLPCSNLNHLGVKNTKKSEDCHKDWEFVYNRVAFLAFLWA